MQPDDPNAAPTGEAGNSALPEEPPLPPGLRRRQVIHLVVFDLAILAELALALYTADAYRERWDFTLVFCVVFFGLVIPTFLASRFVSRRRLRRFGIEAQ